MAGRRHLTRRLPTDEARCLPQYRRPDVADTCAAVWGQGCATAVQRTGSHQSAPGRRAAPGAETAPSGQPVDSIWFNHTKGRCRPPAGLPVGEPTNSRGVRAVRLLVEGWAPDGACCAGTAHDGMPGGYLNRATIAGFQLTGQALRRHRPRHGRLRRRKVLPSTTGPIACFSFTHAQPGARAFPTATSPRRPAGGRQAAALRYLFHRQPQPRGDAGFLSIKGAGRLLTSRYSTSSRATA